VAINPTAAMNGRRFPPPWSIEELDACFVETALDLLTKVAALKTVR
jgi:hypothetical protein